jgi:prevent-host-death family protein
MWTLAMAARTLHHVAVEVGVREFRQSLRAWLDRAAEGETVVVTERGMPKVRVVAATEESILERLVREGRATPPTRPRRRLGPVPRVSDSPLTDALFEQRRSKDY